MPIYLIGRRWYSADQGDFPNCTEFPKLCTTDLEKAEVLYNELAKDDETWSFGFCEAYLIESNDNGYHIIHGGSAIEYMLPNG